MAKVDPHAPRPEGRLIPMHTPDVHVETRRLGAAGLDMVILLMLQVWLGDVLGVTRVTGGSPIRSSLGYTYLTTDVELYWPYLLLLVVAYFSVLEALFGATWGKLVAGLRVVDTDGRRPTLGAVLVRNIIRPIDAWPLAFSIGAVGITAALLSDRRQRLGDRVAGTLVVRAESVPLAYLSGPQVRRRLLGCALGVGVCAAALLAFAYAGRPPLVVEGHVRTASLFDGHPIRSYALGAPHWGPGTVAYDIRYTPVGRVQSCTGTVTLTWHGFFTLKGGWIVDPARTHTTCR